MRQAIETMLDSYDVDYSNVEVSINVDNGDSNDTSNAKVDGSSSWSSTMTNMTASVVIEDTTTDMSQDTLIDLIEQCIRDAFSQDSFVTDSDDSDSNHTTTDQSSPQISSSENTTDNVGNNNNNNDNDKDSDSDLSLENGVKLVVIVAIVLVFLCGALGIWFCVFRCLIAEERKILESHKELARNCGIDHKDIIKGKPSFANHQSIQSQSNTNLTNLHLSKSNIKHVDRQFSCDSASNYLAPMPSGIIPSFRPNGPQSNALPRFHPAIQPMFSSSYCSGSGDNNYNNNNNNDNSKIGSIHPSDIEIIQDLALILPQQPQAREKLYTTQGAIVSSNVNEIEDENDKFEEGEILVENLEVELEGAADTNNFKNDNLRKEQGNETKRKRTNNSIAMAMAAKLSMQRFEKLKMPKRVESLKNIINTFNDKGGESSNSNSDCDNVNVTVDATPDEIVFDNINISQNTKEENVDEIDIYSKEKNNMNVRTPQGW